MKTTGNVSSHEGCNPEWEREEAYRNEWQHSAWGDELWDEGAYYKVEDLLNTALWEEETKHDFWINWDSAVFERELTNADVQKTIQYLYEYQPRVPFSQVKNPTQKQISSFLQKLCK